MLYCIIPYKDRKKAFKLKNELINIFKSYGICPLCFEILIDLNDGYIGKNVKLQVDNNHYHITVCSNCANRIKKTDHREVLEYLNRIEEEITMAFERDDL